MRDSICHAFGRDREQKGGWLKRWVGRTVSVNLLKGTLALNQLKLLFQNLTPKPKGSTDLLDTRFLV